MKKLSSKIYGYKSYIHDTDRSFVCTILKISKRKYCRDGFIRK